MTGTLEPYRPYEDRHAAVAREARRMIPFQVFREKAWSQQEALDAATATYHHSISDADWLAATLNHLGISP